MEEKITTPMVICPYGCHHECEEVCRYVSPVSGEITIRLQCPRCRRLTHRIMKSRKL